MKYLNHQSKKTMTCQPGATTGFPLRLAQKLQSDWPATTGDQLKKGIQQLQTPTDITIQSAAPQQVIITVTQTPTLFQVSGLDSAANGTTITYKNARYICSTVLSIVQNQHPNFLNPSYKVQYEAILAFQIQKKESSLPDIILMCRPVIFDSWSSSPFWEAINDASQKPGSTKQTVLDMATLFGKSKDAPLMPMTTYETCLPVKLIDTKETNTLTVRVYVCSDPVTINAGNGLKKCSSVKKYSFVTVGLGPASLFDATTLQFKDGLGPEGFPSGVRENLIPNSSPGPLTAFTEVISKITYQVPEPSPVIEGFTNTNTSYKCYTIDPNKDIDDKNQILIDPTTGKPLADQMKQMRSNAGIDISGLPEGSSGGLMPGDIEYIFFIFAVSIGSILLFAYLGYVAYLLINKEDFHNGLYHGVIWIVLFLGLFLFGYFIGEKEKQKNTPK